MENKNKIILLLYKIMQKPQKKKIINKKNKKTI